MSESDLADLRSFYEAVAIGNLPVALSALHPKVEVHPPGVLARLGVRAART